jgi:hypothetical protein
MSAFHRLSQVSLIGHRFEDFQLQQPMRGQHPVCNGILLSIVDGKTHNMWDWMALEQQFGVTVTQAITIAWSFFWLSPVPLDPVPLDY